MYVGIYTYRLQVYQEELRGRNETVTLRERHFGSYAYDAVFTWVYALNKFFQEGNRPKFHISDDKSARSVRIAFCNTFMFLINSFTCMQRFETMRLFKTVVSSMNDNFQCTCMQSDIVRKI